MVGYILSGLTFLRGRNSVNRSVTSSISRWRPRSSISDLHVAWGVNVKHPIFLALCIRDTPNLKGWVICKNMHLIYTHEIMVFSKSVPYLVSPC